MSEAVAQQTKPSTVFPKPTLEQSIKGYLLRSGESERSKQTQETHSADAKYEGDLKANHLVDYRSLDIVDRLFQAYVLGISDPKEVEDYLQKNADSARATLSGVAASTISPEKIPEAVILTELQRRESDQKIPEAEDQPRKMPASAESFRLYDAKTGRTREISSFNDQLTRKIAGSVARELKDYFSDRNTSHLVRIARLSRFAGDARSFYTVFSQEESANIQQLLDRLKYLGLTKNFLIEGEESGLIKALIKSAYFGHLTPEDRGRLTGASRNVITTGENPVINAISASITGKDGKPLPGLNDSQAIDLIKAIISNPRLSQLKVRFADNTDIISLVDWTAQETIVRQLLPREAVVPSRVIDMSRLQKIKSLGKEDSSESFQASNPISLWIDPETGRKFVVKQCPEQTLQSDYFGLEMLQLAGVPIYEFYYGYLPGKDGASSQRVLVSGFLEGFQDPSHIISIRQIIPAAMSESLRSRLTSEQQQALDKVLDEPLSSENRELLKSMLTDKEMSEVNSRSKTLFPEEYNQNRDIQQAMLIEILIGEYNSKAHNFMITGKSVQHLDQGGSLNSTASGKFKGFGETVTVQDIQDVLHCYTDWDFDASETVNPAYAKVAEVINGQLVIHDVSVAQKLLHQLRSIPQEKIEEALVKAGYEDGERSIQRMQSWLKQIREKIIPDLYPPPEGKGTDPKKINPSARRDQYIRWAKEAEATFEAAIAAGGELSYYKRALVSRKASLEQIWEKAI